MGKGGRHWRLQMTSRLTKQEAHVMLQRGRFCFPPSPNNILFIGTIYISFLHFTKKYQNKGTSWMYHFTGKILVGRALFIESRAHCSRITRYPSFIAQDFFHFSTQFLKNSKFCKYRKIFSEFYVLTCKKFY